MQPCVSVCIPTYNGEKYFRECLDSILAQTFTDFELLIVDDHSSDETLKIAQEYADRDARIRVTKNERNLGLVGNWNRCIELAQGEWIKFVFQDDLISPQCLEKLFSCINHNKPFICCYRDFIFEEGTSESIQKYYLSLPLLEQLFPDSTIVPASNFCQEVFKQIGRNIIGEPTSVMLHRSVFYKFGVFNSNLIQLCDWEMWTRIISNTGFVYINESLANFRVHASSTSSMNADKQWYRKDILDPLLIAHDFALHPLYSNLRTFALKPSSSDMLSILTNLAVSARKISIRQSIKSADDNHSFFKEWNDIANLYPILWQLSKQNNLKSLIRYYLSKLNFSH